MAAQKILNNFLFILIFNIYLLIRNISYVVYVLVFVWALLSELDLNKNKNVQKLILRNLPTLRMKIKPFHTKTNSFNTWSRKISSNLIYPTPSATHSAKFKSSSGETYQDSRDAFFSLSPLSTVYKFDSECLNLAFQLQVCFLFVDK